MLDALSSQIKLLRMRICICGGGGLGHTCAGVLSNRSGVVVDMLTNHPEKWNHEYIVNIPEGGKLKGRLDVITSNPTEVIPNADIVFFCLPAFLVENEVLKIKPYLKKETIIGAVVGNTGFFIYCHKHLPKDSKLFSLQRVPYVSRVVDYGKEANLLGYRDKLIMAVENVDNRESIRVLVEKLFGEETELADSFYEVTLSNSNPILHTGRLYTMWKDWDCKPFDRCSLFYKEWTIEASQLEIEMDKEFFALLNKLNVSTKHIATLLEHYESTNAEEMTAKLQSIASLSTILSPMKQIDGKWLPDFSSRYFTEDFPFGLRSIVETAKSHNLDIPNLQKVYNWGMSLCTSYLR